MSLEAAIKELTDAVKENTAAHAGLAEVAVKAATGKSTGEQAADDAADKAAEEAAAKKKAEAAEKRKAAAAAKKKAEAEAAEKAAAEDEDEGSDETGSPEVVTEISAVELREAAKEFMSSDDAKDRDANKALVKAALDHLGAGKLSEVTSDEDRAKLATYISFWTADPDAKLSSIDEKIGEEADDMLD